MSDPSSLKARLMRGDRQIACILMIPSPEVAEIVAHSGVDAAMIDHEHGGGDLADFIARARAIEASPMRAMVRVPHGAFGYAQRLLDNGATGLVFPGVDCAADAEVAVAACRYPPRGIRGAGGGIRAARYGMDADYYTPAREDDLLIVAQIESRRAVDNIDAICAVPGIDMLLIGPRDLAASIGMLDRLNDPEVWRMVNLAADRIRAAGKLLASTLHPGRTAAEMFAQGYDLILASKDVDFVMAGARAVAAMKDG